MDNQTEITGRYKRNKIPVYLSGKPYGVVMHEPPPYKYPRGHKCHGCPYTLNTEVPSCMFPTRQDGSCFWLDNKKYRK